MHCSSCACVKRMKWKKGRALNAQSPDEPKKRTADYADTRIRIQRLSLISIRAIRRNPRSKQNGNTIGGHPEAWRSTDAVQDVGDAFDHSGLRALFLGFDVGDAEREVADVQDVTVVESAFVDLVIIHENAVEAVQVLDRPENLPGKTAGNGGGSLRGGQANLGFGMPADNRLRQVHLQRVSGRVHRQVQRHEAQGAQRCGAAPSARGRLQGSLPCSIPLFPGPALITKPPDEGKASYGMTPGHPSSTNENRPKDTRSTRGLFHPSCASCVFYGHSRDAGSPALWRVRLRIDGRTIKPGPRC